MIIYFLLFLFPFFLDRLTKFLILHLGRYYSGSSNFFEVNRFLSIDLTFNRGISWSFFHSQNNYIFFIISFLILFILCLLLYQIKENIKSNKSILGEILIFSGGFSNFLDRIFYGGVIDFILVSYKNFSWPIFNLADGFITIGVFILLISNFKK